MYVYCSDQETCQLSSPTLHIAADGTVLSFLLSAWNRRAALHLLPEHCMHSTRICSITLVITSLYLPLIPPLDLIVHFAQPFKTNLTSISIYKTMFFFTENAWQDMCSASTLTTLLLYSKPRTTK
jgi:hypothetical protein